ncbi:MAG: phosphoenolpyruvate-utilizing N-terminal domain-containing protein [Rhodospirillales bacterium]
MEKLLSGIGVSQGIAIGPLVAASEPALEHTRAKIAAGGVEAELGRLDDAGREVAQAAGKAAGAIVRAAGG